MPSEKKTRKKRLPRPIRLARIFGIYVPTSIRSDTHNFLHHIDTESVCISTPSTQRKQFLLNKGIWNSSLEIKSKHFFIPAPFVNKFCANKSTTLLKEVKSLVHPFRYNITKLEKFHIDSKLIKERTIIAFGYPQTYQIFELEELDALWRSKNQFSFPYHQTTEFGGEYRFSNDQISELKVLLAQEYNNEISRRLVQTILKTEELILLTDYVEYYTELTKMDQIEKSKIEQYLDWTLFSALLMRGWKFLSDDTPLGHHILSDDKESNNLLLKYSLWKILEIYGSCTVSTKDYINKLPLILNVETKYNELGVSTIENCCIDTKDAHIIRDDHETEIFVEEKLFQSQDFLDQVEKLRITCEKGIKNLFSVSNEFQILDATADYHLHEVMSKVIQGKCCCQLASRTLIYSASFYHKLLFSKTSNFIQLNEIGDI